MKKNLSKKENIYLTLILLFVISLAVIDLFFCYTEVGLYSYIVALTAVIIPAVISAIIKNHKLSGVFFNLTVILFSLVSVPAAFFNGGTFVSYRLVFFIPALILLMVFFEGTKRIFSLCLSIIISVITIIFQMFLPNILPFETAEPGVSASIWSVIATAAFLLLIIYVRLYEDNKTASHMVHKEEGLESLESFSDKGILLCFYIEKSEELKKEIGSVEYHILYNKVKNFMEGFKDNDTKVISYGGDRFLFYFRKRDIDFVGDLADGVILSVNDDLNIKEPMFLNANVYVKDSNEDMMSAIRKADTVQ